MVLFLQIESLLLYCFLWGNRVTLAEVEMGMLRLGWSCPKYIAKVLSRIQNVWSVFSLDFTLSCFSFPISIILNADQFPWKHLIGKLYKIVIAKLNNLSYVKYLLQNEVIVVRSREDFREYKMMFVWNIFCSTCLSHC